MQKTYSKRSRFTLIELCIVLIISGLLLAAMIAIYSQYQKRLQITQTQDHLVIAEQSLQSFYQKYGFYPCPARLNAPPNDPAFGRAQDCDTMAGTVIAGAFPVTAPNPDYLPACAGSTDPVACPLSTRNEYISLISFSDTLDGWNNRLTYAVTRSMAIDKNHFSINDAALILNNLDNSTSTNEPFLILSHGPDGNGAYTRAGTLSQPCPPAGTAQDSENCNNNAVYNLTDNRSLAAGAVRFDDFVQQHKRRATTSACNRDPDVGPVEVMIGVEDDGTPECAPDNASICNQKGLVYRGSSDLAADADGCSYPKGVLVGQCWQGWQGLDYAPTTIIGPAYWDNTYITCLINPTGMFGGAGGWHNNSCRKGCSCPAGYALQNIGECSSHENIGINTGSWCSRTNHSSGSYTYGWTFFACRKL